MKRDRKATQDPRGKFRPTLRLILGLDADADDTAIAIAVGGAHGVAAAARELCRLKPTAGTGSVRDALGALKDIEAERNRYRTSLLEVAGAMLGHGADPKVVGDGMLGSHELRHAADLLRAARDLLNSYHHGEPPAVDTPWKHGNSDEDRLRHRFEAFQRGYENAAREVKTLTERNAELREDVAEARKEAKAWRDEYTGVCDELRELKAANLPATTAPEVEDVKP